MNRAYVFEDVTLWLMPFFMWALFRGHPLYVFELSSRMRRFKSVREAIRDGRVTLIYVYAAPGVGRYAIDKADELFERMKGSGVVKLTCDLYVNPQAVRIYKKAIVKDLFNARFITYYLERLLHEGVASTICFFPCQYTSTVRLLRRYGLADEHATLNAKVSVPPVAFNFLATRLRSVWSFVKWVVPFAMISLVQVVMCFAAKPSKPTARAAIGWSINSPWLIKFKGGRRYDFIIDEDKIKSEDVAYLVETPLPGEFIAEETGRGRRFFSLSRTTMVRDLMHKNVLGDDALPFLKALSKGMWQLFSAPILLGTYMSSLSQFVYWNVLLRRISIGKYVYTNNESSAQIATDILLQAKGVDVWRYSVAIGAPYLFYTEGGRYDDACHEFAFFNTENWMFPNEAVRDSYASLNQNVGNAVVIGNYFAELIIKSMESGSCNEAFLELFPGKVFGTNPIIAIFDTTYIGSDDCQTSMRDGIAFLEDFAAVAERMPETLFLYKPSKPSRIYSSAKYMFSSPKSGCHLLEIREKFGALPNVALVNDGTDPTEIIAMSEVVVTHCFSSPTADALSSGKKAFWYEPCDKNVGTIMDRVGGVTVRGRERLEERLKQLAPFGATQDRTSNNNAMFKKCIDPFMDGKALDRMRAMLSADAE